MNKTKIGVVLLFISQAALGQDEIFDSHVHLWNGAESVRNYLVQLDTSNQSVTRFGGILMAEKGNPTQTKLKNDELIRLSEQNPKLIPICSVHPLDGAEAILEIKRLSKLGVKIVKLHPHTQKFNVNDDRVLKLCKEAGVLGLIILMDNANIIPGDSENLFDLAIKCSNTKFIFAHMGAFNFRFWNIIAVARTAKDFYMNNIYFDVSATVVLLADSPLEGEFVWTLRNAGIDNILLGSDFPQYTLEQAVTALDRLDLKQEEKNKIRYKNAQRLLFPDEK